MSTAGSLAPQAQHAKSGLYVKAKNGVRLRDNRVRRLVRKMRVACPWFEDSDMPACRAWAELEILSTQVYAALKDIGPVNWQNVKDGDVSGRRLVNDYRQLRLAQAVFSRELGLTPQARMTLKATGTRAALDLAAAMAAPEDAEEVQDGD